MDILSLLDRTAPLFEEDVKNLEAEMSEIIPNNKFLVIGGAGSIGQAVTKEIFKRNPHTLHVIDISENNMVELVRDIRSTYGYIKGDFRTFIFDCGSQIMDHFLTANAQYDYILNLSALKHVRSERDPYTLMRLVEVNITNTIKIAQVASQQQVKKYFCVSSDKATNPANMMGASKRIMEMFLMRESERLNISTARFANVAFSDGSLLQGFNNRINKMQPITAPKDIRRYFVTPQESGELCLLSCLFGENRDIFFPKLSEHLDLLTFSQIAERYIQTLGYKPYICETEDEARKRSLELIGQKNWPCFFFNSDTSGEKDFEEFFTGSEQLELERFSSIGIIHNDIQTYQTKLVNFENRISSWIKTGVYSRDDLIDLFNDIIPNFDHKETGKFLDSRM